ncbi:helix-turn-helix domain-containing protein [Lapidilactobacillus mulanensis]|uniref:Helix-turn-helix domain-containing protein n=1 Tax=Lapidilactobacillus mulanensis TaxID=2485999 RepID=A0ABW4DPB4_9LACO|nr:helix-turn-helix transcriptional regulator [Lapidilactobacillus mulanensis]
MFAERLKELRKNKRETQVETAKRLGFAPTTLASYEQGKRQPDQETLVAIANYFNVTVDYLLGINNTPKDATNQETKDLHRILDQGQLTYREEPVSDEAQEAVKSLLEGYYWRKGRNRVQHDKKDDKE